MDELTQTPTFGGLFLHSGGDPRQLRRHAAAPKTLSDPQTGRALRLATVERLAPEPK